MESARAKSASSLPFELTLGLHEQIPNEIKQRMNRLKETDRMNKRDLG
jgi:hypothetical protein